jgi:primosomal protein N' (replication factor Y)
MIPYGPGVDRIAEEIQKFFPKASIAALTSDVTQEESKAIWEKIFQQEIDIIIGTQLLAKGHHVPNLTLVGILDGDMGLRGADWRANEKAFQLLQQVSGRAGREEKVGEVFIQTFQPDHFLFNTLQQENQEDFLINELNIREAIGLPPYKRLAAITLSGIDAIKTEKEAKTLARFLKTNAHESLEVLGPIEAPLFKLQSRFRYQILLKAPKVFHLSQFIENYIRQIKISSSIRVLIDIDPI